MAAAVVITAAEVGDTTAVEVVAVTPAEVVVTRALAGATPAAGIAKKFVTSSK
jgi:hypothetical protein